MALAWGLYASTIFTSNNMAFKDTFRFFLKYITNPRFTGAVCPSWRFLSSKMAQGVGVVKKGVVVELGPGTGPVTDYLLRRNIAGANLYSIEFDKTLAANLQKRFPQVMVVNDSAENISACLGDRAAEVYAVVSSLPLVSLPNEIVQNILSEVEKVLPVGGRYIQFTYNLLKSPDRLEFKRMKHIKTSIVFINIPPARVDVFEKF